MSTGRTHSAIGRGSNGPCGATRLCPVHGVHALCTGGPEFIAQAVRFPPHGQGPSSVKDDG